LHAISIARDPAQAKVLAYTAECIRARVPQTVTKTEFTAVVEIEPSRENPRHQFVSRLFEEQKISIVPLNRIEKFAEELRVRVN
jgi:transcription initiation factor TFIIIB Brf1 subunit/transcription initiation factor TFIIB